MMKMEPFKNGVYFSMENCLSVLGYKKVSSYAFIIHYFNSGLCQR